MHPLNNKILFEIFRLNARKLKEFVNKQHHKNSQFFTCFFVEKGRIDTTIGFNTFKIKNGDLLFIPPGQVFQTILKTSEIQGFYCSFDKEILVLQNHHDMFSHFGFLHTSLEPSFHIPHNIKPFINAIFERLLLEYKENGGTRFDIVNPYIMTLFFEINRLAKTKQAPVHAREKELNQKFQQLLTLHIREIHAVDEYAGMMNISKNHLTKIITKHTGISPIRWINQSLIAESKILLSDCKLSIAEVAEELKILDPSYFSRVFKKYEGQTPGEFRKGIEKS